MTHHHYLYYSNDYVSTVTTHGPCGRPMWAHLDTPGQGWVVTTNQSVHCYALYFISCKNEDADTLGVRRLFYKKTTTKPLLIHASWVDMWGYGGWCKIAIWYPPIIMGYEGYEFSEVWVKRGSAVTSEFTEYFLQRSKILRVNGRRCETSERYSNFEEP
jgi:hypothetical protein